MIIQLQYGPYTRGQYDKGAIKGSAPQTNGELDLVGPLIFLPVSPEPGIGRKASILNPV